MAAELLVDVTTALAAEHHELAESERAASARAPSRFAQWLAEALAERGWSQRELARRIGTSPESVSRWNRRVRPAPARCEAIARELDVAPEQVLMLAGHDTAAPEPKPGSTGD